MRGQKGITLVALIITIVVLLILAVVSITALQNGDIINKANTAANTWQGSVANEQSTMDTLEGQLNNYLPKN